MDKDSLPLSDRATPTKRVQSVLDLQRTIAENIATLVGFTPTNELLIRFINDFGHPNQLRCLAEREISEESKQKLIEKIKGWEAEFTDSVYRAAVILANREKRKHPERKGINMKNIIHLAQDLIRQENEGQESVHHAIGYRG